MGKIETYAQMSARHQKEYNEFAHDRVHYAFGPEQLKELLAKLGYSDVKELKGKYVSIPGGGIISVEDYPKLLLLFKKHDAERKKMRQVGKRLYEMFCQAMANLEYIVTGDDGEILAYCGISMQEFNSDKRYGKAWKKAYAEYMAQYERSGDDE